MITLQEQLLQATRAYIDAKNKLEGIERQYNALYARLYLQENILGMKTEEMRKNEMIRIMEVEHSGLLNDLYDLRGKSREAYYMREALSIILSGGQNGFERS